jgi:hypothetical protein
VVDTFTSSYIPDCPVRFKAPLALILTTPRRPSISACPLGQSVLGFQYVMTALNPGILQLLLVHGISPRWCGAGLREGGELSVGIQSRDGECAKRWGWSLHSEINPPITMTQNRMLTAPSARAAARHVTAWIQNAREGRGLPKGYLLVLARQGHPYAFDRSATVHSHSSEAGCCRGVLGDPRAPLFRRLAAATDALSGPRAREWRLTD